MPALSPDARWRTLIDLFTAVADRGARPAVSAPSADGDMTTLEAEALVELVAGCGMTALSRAPTNRR